MIGKQGVLVASNSAEAVQIYHLNGHLAKDEQALTEKEKSLRSNLIWSPEDFDYLALKLQAPQYFVSTDNNLYLEYSTPKGNAVEYNAYEYNIDMLNTMREERIKLNK